MLYFSSVFSQYNLEFEKGQKEMFNLLVSTAVDKTKL